MVTTPPSSTVTVLEGPLSVVLALAGDDLVRLAHVLDVGRQRLRDDREPALTPTTVQVVNSVIAAARATVQRTREAQRQAMARPPLEDPIGVAAAAKVLRLSERQVARRARDYGDFDARQPNGPGTAWLLDRALVHAEAASRDDADSSS